MSIAEVNHLFMQWAQMWGTLVFGKWVHVIGLQTVLSKSGTSLQHPCQCRCETIPVFLVSDVVCQFINLKLKLMLLDLCLKFWGCQLWVLTVCQTC